MKNLLLIAIASLSLSAFAGTNTVTVKVDLSDVQQEQLKFLKRYYGLTNSLAQISTNFVADVNWTPQAQFILSQRRMRVVSAMTDVSDDVIASLENALGLAPMVSNVPLAP